MAKKSFSGCACDTKNLQSFCLAFNSSDDRIRFPPTGAGPVKADSWVAEEYVDKPPDWRPPPRVLVVFGVFCSQSKRGSNISINVLA